MTLCINIVIRDQKDAFAGNIHGNYTRDESVIKVEVKKSIACGQ